MTTNYIWDIKFFRFLSCLSDDKYRFHDFKLGVQLQKEADKFDDVVFGYQTAEGQQFKYSCVQAKHATNANEILFMNQIKLENHICLQTCNKDFCIKKYFRSFQIINAFGDGEIENFIIFTNRIADRYFESNGLKPYKLQFPDKADQLKAGKVFKFSIDGKKFQNLLDFVSPKEEGASTQTDEVKKQFKEFLDKLLLFVEQPNITEIENEIKLKTSNKIFDEVMSSINNFSSRRNKDMWIQKKKTL